MTPILAPRPRGDRGFERIYRKHAADVYRYAFAVLRNQADAEDVAQTTFMNAYRAYQAGERPRQPHNWLIAIAHNVCRQRFRQSQRRVQEVAYDDGVAEALVADDDAPTADDIKRALSHLAFNQRAALVMRELEGRSYAEIAEVLDVSVSAVETLVFRARRALREQLEGRLTCHEAELALSRQLDGALGRGEKGQLRAHLRECAECATLARKLRAQRAAIRSLGLVPLPASLASLFGGAAAGGAAWGLGSVGAGVAVKAAAGFAAAAIVAGGSYELVREAPWQEASEVPAAARSAPATARPAQATAAPAAAAAAAAVPAVLPARGAPAAAATGARSDRAAVAAARRQGTPAAAADQRGKPQDLPAVAGKKAVARSPKSPAGAPKVAAAGKRAPGAQQRPARNVEPQPAAQERAKSAVQKRKLPARRPGPARATRKDRASAASKRVDVPSSLPGPSRPPAPGLSP